MIGEIFLCFFFFSSRRRHTRYWRDWSSDVCSSDLGRLHGADGVAALALTETVDDALAVAEAFAPEHLQLMGRRASSLAPRVRRRSEEHTSELQSRQYLVCRLLLEKKKQDI